MNENIVNIDETNAALVKAKVILQGANIPVTPMAERILQIDAGNSGAKWRVVSSDKVLERGAARGRGGVRLLQARPTQAASSKSSSEASWVMAQ